MSEDFFNKIYLGEFKSDGTDYPELKNEMHFSGIYSHRCRICGREFFGYKRRVHCFDCNQVIKSKGDSDE